jgi:hypothetical protein
VARREDLDRSPIAEGFYYDIEFPDGNPGDEDLGRSRSGWPSM